MAKRTGNIIYDNFDRFNGVPFNATVVTDWHDGTPMDDSKVDNVIYFKNTSALGGGYSKRNISNAIELNWFPVISDGNETTFTGTDNRLVIELALRLCSALNRPLNIDGTYLTSQLRITWDNIIINFTSGSRLIAPLTMGAVDRLFWLDNVDNVTINGNSAKFVAPIFTDGEHRHLVTIQGGNNITISDLECVGGGGDGFYIFGVPNNVSLNRTRSNLSRRNGLSLISGVNVNITDHLSKDISGTAPSAGIDIEPNGTVGERLEGVRIINATTQNCGGHGIDVALGNFSDNESKYCDIVISNHTSINDGSDYNGSVAAGFRLAGNGYVGTWVNKVTGQVLYDGAIMNPAGDGVSIHSWHYDKSPKGIINAKIINVGFLGAATKSGVNIFNSSGSTFECGNVTLDVDISDTRVTSNTYTGIYFQNGTMGMSKIKATIGGDYRNTFGRNVVQAGGAVKTHAEIGFKDVVTYNEPSSVSAGSSVHDSGGFINMTSGGTFSLPAIANVIGQVFTINSTSASPVTITPSSGDKILLNVDNKTASIVLSEPTEFIRIKATSDGWVKENGSTKGRVLLTGGNPPKDILFFSAAPVNGTWSRGTVIFSVNAANQSNAGWVCVASGTPGSWIPFGKIGLDINKPGLGTTANRPVVTEAGFMYFDTTLVKPIWWNGTIWTDASGTSV